MVPSPDAAAWSVSSNDLYAHSVENVFNETLYQDGPGHDYSFLSTTYPPQWKASDLKQQVDEFLDMPKPRSTPGSTLWVFSFGLWDVWSLSALPIDAGVKAVGAMTRDHFEQIERLYAASTDPESIAYSSRGGFRQKSGEETGENQKEGAREADQLEARDHTEGETQTEPAVGTGKTHLADAFHILVQRLIDPSLLPGWRDVRPALPAPHSKAEQMRNAANLTGTWNDGIGANLREWVTKDDLKRGDDDNNNNDNNKKEKRFSFTGVKPDTGAGPPRDAFAYNVADYVMTQMLERQMRNAHLTDGAGLGQGELEDGFRDVRSPCLQPVSTAVVGVSAQTDVRLDIPNEKIDGDKQRPSTPTPGAEAGAAAAAAAGKSRRSDAREEKWEGLAYSSVARVCQFPGDHLFYTPFALSQRAIQEVAAETADMIRKGETVRAMMSS